MVKMLAERGRLSLALLLICVGKCQSSKLIYGEQIVAGDRVSAHRITPVEDGHFMATAFLNKSYQITHQSNSGVIKPLITRDRSPAVGIKDLKWVSLPDAPGCKLLLVGKPAYMGGVGQFLMDKICHTRNAVPVVQHVVELQGIAANQSLGSGFDVQIRGELLVLLVQTDYFKGLAVLIELALPEVFNMGGFIIKGTFKDVSDSTFKPGTTGATFAHVNLPKELMTVHAFPAGQLDSTSTADSSSHWLVQAMPKEGTMTLAVATIDARFLVRTTEYSFPRGLLQRPFTMSALRLDDGRVFFILGDTLGNGSRVFSLTTATDGTGAATFGPLTEAVPFADRITDVTRRVPCGGSYPPSGFTAHGVVPGGLFQTFLSLNPLPEACAAPVDCPKSEAVEIADRSVAPNTTSLHPESDEPTPTPVSPPRPLAEAEVKDKEDSAVPSGAEGTCSQGALLYLLLGVGLTLLVVGVVGFAYWKFQRSGRGGSAYGQKPGESLNSIMDGVPSPTEMNDPSPARQAGSEKAS